MRFWVAAAPLVAVAWLFFSAAGAPSNDDKLTRLRNLGKAFYENPTTQNEAVEQFRQALALAPDSVRERLNYGLSLLRAGKTAEGTTELERVQKADPSLPHTWFNLGIVWKKAGETEKALAQFRRLVELAPNDAIAQYQFGTLLRASGDTEGAAKAIETAARLDHTLAAPHFQLFNLYRAAGRTADAKLELALFQELKKGQEGSATPEDVDWNAFAEVYDPIEPSAAVERREPRYVPGRVLGPGTRAAVLGRGVFVLWGPSEVRLSTDGVVMSGQEVLDVAVGDFDNDGYHDLCVVTAKGPRLYAGRGGKMTAGGALPEGSWRQALWIDYDHDYDLDLLLIGAKSTLLRNAGAAGFEDRTADFPFVAGDAVSGTVFRLVPDTKGFDVAVSYSNRSGVLYRDLLQGRYRAEDLASVPARSDTEVLTDADLSGTPRMVPGLATADVDGDGLEDVLRTDGKSVQVWLNRTPVTGRNWIGVGLEGVRNLKLAQGAEVEVKAGRLYSKRRYEGIPLLFGLGPEEVADTVRITWPNGLIQNEMRQPAKRRHSYKEAQRLSGSCPIIWSWNGSRFEYITDVLGVAPLGAAAGEGEYFPTDHDEYVQIPGRALRERDGVFEVRVTEELSEVAYLDSIRLLAVDRPADMGVYTSEKFKGPPFPRFRLYGVRGVSRPVAARDDEGRDVLDRVLRKDRTYPDSFERTLGGVAGPHWLEIDFGAGAPERSAMVLHGWVDWADGSTFLGQAQARRELIAPSLQVRDESGRWVTVDADMGMPAGKPKTIVVEMAGKWRSASRAVRIVTNLCVYWDEVFLTGDVAEPGLPVRKVAMKSAELRFRGFSPNKVDPKRTQPERFEYEGAFPVSLWNPTPGMYTRYGDVRRTLGGVDDRLVVMGSGDELRLLFDARSVPPVRDGWRREFLLHVDGWAKDRDANTAHGQTTSPLPFRAMSQYPYGAAETGPKGEDLTRPALQLIRPLGRVR